MINRGESDAPLRGLWEDTAPAAPATAPLTETIDADVAVIGAGYTGLSAALHLTAAGRSVAVLEARDIGYGGSGRNVGLVNAGMWVTPDQVCKTLAAPFGERLLQTLGTAPALVFELIGRYAMNCEAQRSGTLHCAVGRRGLDDLRRRAAQWQARGAAVELLDAAQAAAKCGTGIYAGALWDRRAGTVQPLAYARGLARAAMQAGARVFTGSAAQAAERLADGWTVRTAHGRVRAPWIIVATDAYATGPWSQVDAQQVHLPYFNVSTVPLDAGALAAILPERQGAWDTQRVLCSFRLDGSGRLIIGSVGALEGSGRSVHTDWAARTIARMFPSLRKVALERRWYGTIGMTADRLPRFHLLAPNVIAFCGYNGRGIAPGTVFGRLLAQVILGEVTQDELPLPVSPVRAPMLRSLEQAAYRVGSQIVHFAQGR